MSDKENDTPNRAVTQTTKKLQAALENRELMDRLVDAGEIILDSANTLIAGSERDRSKAAAFSTLKELGTFFKNLSGQCQKKSLKNRFLESFLEKFNRKARF